MSHEFVLQRRVEFYETDMAGIVHFSNFFRYMESTEHAFFRSLGLRLHREEEGVVSGFARVNATCNYVRPLRYPDLFEVRLLVRDKRPSAFRYAFEFRLPDAPEPVARGTLETVHVSRGADGERLRATPMPAAFLDAVQVAPEEPSTEDRS